MNFLAHLYLSGDEEELIIGNFIADMVKGQQINGYGKGVVDGIRLHRKIDRYTDSHPVFLRSKERLRKKYRLYSGVVVDMYYDHFLSKHWSRYSHHQLETYVDKAYGLLESHFDDLPPRAQYILPFMIEHNWLVHYADLGRLGRHFAGMARRTPFDSGMERAVEDLRAHYDAFEGEFAEFFPELVNYVASQGVSHAHHRNG